MSIKTEEYAEESEHSPIKNALKLLGWVFFFIIAINLIVRLFEIFINNYGQDSFFYLLIFLFSIGSIFIIYPKLSRMFQQDHIRDMEKYLKNNNNNNQIVIGYLVKDEEQDGFLDLNGLLNRKTIKNDKKFEEDDKKTWLEEERKLFRV